MTGVPGPASDSIGSIGTRAAGLALAAAFGQAFVVAREVFVAAEVGTSVDLDALLVALIAPAIAVSLLSSSTQAALVPALVELRATHGRDVALRLAGVLIASVAGLGIVVAAVLAWLAAPVMTAGGPGLSDASRLAAESYLPALLPMVVIAPVGVLLAAVCQAHGMYRAISVSWVAGPAAAFIVTLAAWGQAGVGALAIAATVDAAATTATLAALLAGARLLPLPGTGVPRDSVIRYLRHAVPLIAGSSVLQLNLLTDRAVASILSAGAVSALRYGERIIRTPLSVLAPAWSTTVFPAVVAAATLGEHVDDPTGSVGRTVTEAVRFVIAVFLPLALATAALAPIVVAVAFERGAFDAVAAATTAGVVVGFAPLIVVWLVQPILTAAHNARRRGGLLARIAILNAASNVALNLIFGLALGVAGVALSTSITGLLLVGILMRRLRDLEPEFDLGAIVRVGLRSFAAALVPTLPIAAITWLARPPLDLPGQLGFLMLSTVVGGGVYLALSRVIGLAEPGIAAAALTRLGKRRLGLAA